MCITNSLTGYARCWQVHDIYALEWDEETEHHLARHGVSIADAWEIIANRHITRGNPEEEDRITLTGETNAGRLLTFSLVATADPGTWRPITGWSATKAEVTLFRRHV